MFSDTFPTPYMELRLAARLREKKALLDRLRPLPSATLRLLSQELRSMLTYHSNAIEGNTLNLRETQLILEQGLTIGGHTLHEHLEVSNHGQAYDLLQQLVEQATIITPAHICALHRLVTQQLLDEHQSGHFRRIPVHISGSAHVPAPASQVPALMEFWCSWLTGAGLQYGPVIRAAIAHHGFVAVHPFRDDNGRVGRLLLNVVLMQHGYPPALMRKEWRISYLQALSAADAGRYTTLVNLVGRSVEQGLDLYLDTCRSSTSINETHDLPLQELAQRTGHTRDYLALLIRKGRLAATKRGSRWYSSEAAVKHYLQSVANKEVPRGRPHQAESK